MEPLAWMLPLLRECDRLANRVHTLEAALACQDQRIAQLELEKYAAATHKEPHD